MEQRVALPGGRTERVYRLAAQSAKRTSPTRRLAASPDGGVVSTPLADPSVEANGDVARFSTRPPASSPALIQAQTLAAPVTSATTTGQLDPSSATRRRKPWTRWRVVRWVGAVVGAGVAIYAVWVVSAFVHLQGDIYKPLLPTATPNPMVIQGTASARSAAGIAVTPTEDPYSDLPSGHIYILALGSDKRPDALGLSPRSDTMILVNLDTQTRTVSMLTIPRDLAVAIPGYPGRQKINAAYFLGERDLGPGGGQTLAAQTVSQLFNVPIDYYVMINFEGFRTLVDTLGGVDIDVPAPIDDYNYPSENPADPFGQIYVHFDAGWQHMDGIQALRYARTRHADSDFGRSRRQLQLIMAIKRKATSLDLLTKLPGVLDQLAGMIETNIPPDKQLPLLQAGYDLDPSRILSTTIGADLVTPVILSDRSEALSLNVKKAKPVLDAFFGRQPSATPTRPTRRRTPTVTVMPTRTPAKTPTSRQTVTTPQNLPNVTRVAPNRTATSSLR